MDIKKLLLILGGIIVSIGLFGSAKQPNIVLVMADDQGWGQTSYNGHPILKTPNLDAMAASGLRFNRFYAAGPVCSPTRASVLTGRTPERTGVPEHGNNLRLQEKTLPQALKKAGYLTSHFGKWHLNGIRGPGVPVLGDDPYHPGRYGFDHWLTVTNYFDMNPLMSRMGEFEEFHGDSSEVIVTEALKFISDHKDEDAPFFTVIWYGSPHSPFEAFAEDRIGQEKQLANHLGEIVAMDRSIGTLRQGLRDMGLENDTLVWFCSDNGGLEVDPDSVGGLRGFKQMIFEGGIRVPAIIEWPGHIEPAVSDEPASTMDIMPTLIDLLELPDTSMLMMHDGESILPLLKDKDFCRKRPIPFLFQQKAALIDGDYKLLSTAFKKESEWELYNLKNDPSESRNLAGEQPGRFEELKKQMEEILLSIKASASGKDYPEEKLIYPDRRLFWTEMEEYKPHLKTFFKRPEYSEWENHIPDSFEREKP